MIRNNRLVVQCKRATTTPFNGRLKSWPPRIQLTQYAQWYNKYGQPVPPPPPRKPSVIVRWVYSPKFYYVMAGLGAFSAAVWIANMEEVPISGRRRFNIVPPDMERSVAEAQYKQFIQEVGSDILPAWHPDVLRVKRVMARLISGLKHLENQGMSDKSHGAAVTSGEAPWTDKDGLDAWEVNVINAPIMNAMVLPGNKVFFFTPMLDVCQDDNGIATVLGHEMAHSICHHSAERMSSQFVFRGVSLLVGFTAFIDFGVISAVYSYLLYSYLAYDYLWDKPSSRTQESEADHLGLLLMAASCYDPAASIGFWRRMSQATGAHRAIPEFLSTHPDDRTRIKQLGEWMESAKLKYANSQCGTYDGWKRGFMQTAEYFR